MSLIKLKASKNEGAGLVFFLFFLGIHSQQHISDRFGGERGGKCWISGNFLLRTGGKEV